MKLDAKKVVFSKPISLYEAALIYSSIAEEYNKEGGLDNFYYYVGIEDTANVYIEAILSTEVNWVSKELDITPRESVVMLCEYPDFYETLKDHLYNCGINDYKRFSVFTESDIMGEGSRVWEDYIGRTQEDAMEFYRDILLIKDIVSIIEHDEEEET
jgi:hypothetical protein